MYNHLIKEIEANVGIYDSYHFYCKKRIHLLIKEEMTRDTSKKSELALQMVYDPRIGQGRN